MSGTIAIELAGQPEIGIDGTRVAQGFGLDVDTFRRLMDARSITLLCERGTGEDAGLYRASFYHGTRRVRMVVDGEGTVVPGGFSVDELPDSTGTPVTASHGCHSGRSEYRKMSSRANERG